MERAGTVTLCGPLKDGGPVRRAWTVQSDPLWLWIGMSCASVCRDCPTVSRKVPLASCGCGASAWAEVGSAACIRFATVEREAGRVDTGTGDLHVYAATTAWEDLAGRTGEDELGLELCGLQIGGRVRDREASSGGHADGK